MDAVLFDWRGTLVVDPPETWWIDRALKRAGRTPGRREADRLAAAIAAAQQDPGFVAGQAHEDCDPDFHRQLNLDMLGRAGLDPELAEALYELDFDPQSHPMYTDVPYALRRLKEAGLAVAVVSDIHFDLRPEFAAVGLDDCIAEFILSFEHGVQKPNPRMFELALERLQVEPSAALMVGDRASHDGGAVAVGITTLILPCLQAPEPRGMDLVLRAAGVDQFLP